MINMNDFRLVFMLALGKKLAVWGSSWALLYSYNLIG